MKAWAARQKDGSLEIFCEKPVLVEGEEDGEEYSYFDAPDVGVSFLETMMGQDFHTEVTRENSPRLIELTDEDLLSVVRRKLEAQEAHFQKRHNQTGGYMAISEVAMMMGQQYSLSHLRDLLEASINYEKGDEQ